MIGDKIANWFNQALMPRLDWVQVEVTSFCNAFCVYCPRTVYREKWRNRHLPTSTFDKLMSSLPETGILFLQGWGEPLLNPHFIEMVRVAKAWGLQVGATTNGTLIDDEMADILVDSGIDVLAFSLAGATPEQNDRFRVGADLEKVLEAMALVKKARDKKGGQSPRINLAYLLLRSGSDDIRALPGLISGLDVSQVVVSTLDFVPSEKIQQEALIPPGEEEFHSLAARLQKVAGQLSMINTELHYQLYWPGPSRLTCMEKPRQSLFVSSDGSVSPCVFTNLPISGGHFFNASSEGKRALPEWKKVPMTKLNFGNINNQPLHGIWRGKDYIPFRNSFFEKETTSPCQSCAKLYLRQSNEVSY